MERKLLENREELYALTKSKMEELIRQNMPNQEVYGHNFYATTKIEGIPIRYCQLGTTYINIGDIEENSPLAKNKGKRLQIKGKIKMIGGNKNGVRLFDNLNVLKQEEVQGVLYNEGSIVHLNKIDEIPESDVLEANAKIEEYIAKVNGGLIFDKEKTQREMLPPPVAPKQPIGGNNSII